MHDSLHELVPESRNQKLAVHPSDMLSCCIFYGACYKQFALCKASGV